MVKLRINSIYFGFEGEGVHLGKGQVFVRLQGCNLGCRNCDSKDTWSFQKGQMLSPKDILLEVNSLGPKGSVNRVSITGGDPLDSIHIDGVVELARLLKSEGKYVNIEASGNKMAHNIFDIIDFVSFDFKTPSTGVQTEFSHIIDLYKHYKGKFQIKSVVENREDFEYIFSHWKRLVESEEKPDPFTWLITPCYNTQEEFPAQRFQDIYTWNFEVGSPFRIIGQQHKWIYGPKKKNV